MAIWDEQLRPLNEKANLPGKPSRSKLLKWALEGEISKATGCLVKLEWKWFGRQRMTSVEAFRRFLDELNGRAESSAA